uniref:Transposase n=1 Tax=Globodera rostochiensis TaxID=31243 RepID=A0A914IEA0_GLORO
MMKNRRPENAYQNKEHCKIAREIARELGTSRDNIYQWKRDLGKTQKPNKQYVDDYDDKTKLARHRVKIEGKIANKLGIYRAKIIQWKSEIKQRQSMEEDNQTKLSLIKKFDKIKNEYKQKDIYNYKQRANIECGIAKELGTNRDQIYKWKRQLVSERKSFTSEQKREIIEQFDKLKEQFSCKFKSKPTKQIEEKFAQKFDISAQSIHNWKKDFGLIRAKKHKYTDSERLEIIAKYDNMKKNNPALSDEQIVKSFDIKMSTIKQWRRKLGIVTK